ncbi:MAG: ATP-binding cassette domain-containing protein, partial [Alistipes sp.]|nr:ATP-binding cassette domain-containing protein [Alistipes sp.]
KSNQVQSRVKQLEKLERLEVDEDDSATLNIKFPPAPRSGQIVAEIKGVGKSFPPRQPGGPVKHVFSGADFTIERGEKIALVGRNGEGKTTMSRILIGELEPTEGTVRVGANVNLGYYAQNQDDLMDGNFTVYDTLDRVAVGDIRTRLRDILGAFLFRGDDVDKKVKVLSGGERSRLAMARLMLEPRNLLVLDEPTNHMDMRSKDILKRALVKYDGTVVVVSHDREFLDGLIDKVYEFRDGGVCEYLGDIWYFLEKRKLESLRQVEQKSEQKGMQPAKTTEKSTARKAVTPEKTTVRNAATLEKSPKQAPSPSPSPSSSSASSSSASSSSAVAKSAAPAVPAASGREDYARRKEAEREVRRIERAIAQIEKQITELEADIAAWDARLADPAAHGIDPSDGTVFAAYNELKRTLAGRMHEWEKFNYELDILNDQNGQNAVSSRYPE